MGDEPDTQVRVHHSDDDVDFNDDKYNTHRLLVTIDLVKAPIKRCLYIFSYIISHSQMDSSGSAVGATEEEDLRAEVRS